MANILTTNLEPLVAGATAAASLASLALVVPLTTNPGATQGYQPNPAATQGTSALTSLASLSLGGTLSSLATGLPPALIFHYEGENNASLESDITDHYIEDNSAVADQIAIKPEMVTVRGFIGELNNILPLPLKILQTITSSLLLVDSYSPQTAVTAQIKLNEAELLYQSAASIASSAVSAWSSIATAIGAGGAEVVSGAGVFAEGVSFAQNLQQTMFQQFYGYWFNRTLFNVQTPWAVITNMAIKSLRAIQDEETRMITNFEVTFKKIRTASTNITSAVVLSIGRAATQSADLTQSGTTAGVPGASLGSNITAVQ